MMENQPETPARPAKVNRRPSERRFPGFTGCYGRDCEPSSLPFFRIAGIWFSSHDSLPEDAVVEVFIHAVFL